MDTAAEIRALLENEGEIANFYLPQYPLGSCLHRLLRIEREPLPIGRPVEWIFESEVVLSQLHRFAAGGWDRVDSGRSSRGIGIARYTCKKEPQALPVMDRPGSTRRASRPETAARSGCACHHHSQSGLQVPRLLWPAKAGLAAAQVDESRRQTNG